MWKEEEEKEEFSGEKRRRRRRRRRSFPVKRGGGGGGRVKKKKKKVSLFFSFPWARFESQHSYFLKKKDPPEMLRFTGHKQRPIATLTHQFP